MDEVFQTTEVFTPTTPARLTFVERADINERLVNALRTPGKQVVVYGHSGSGKTTLLVNKLHQLYESHIVTRCTSGVSFDQILLDAFWQVGAFYDESRMTERTREAGASIRGEYLAVKAELTTKASHSESTTARPVVTPPLAPQTLGRFLGAAGVCWVLEDFHKVDEPERRRLAQAMKVFMDLADEFPSLRIAAIGAVDTARQVVEYDPEMRNRVSEFLVPLMTVGEVRSIIKKGEELLNISMPSGVADGIVAYSNGLASVCHQLCLNVCQAAGIEETSDICVNVDARTLEKAVSQYLSEASDTFKAAFDKARRLRKKAKYDNVNLILRALIELPSDGGTHAEVLSKVRAWELAYPDSNARYFLEALRGTDRGEIVGYDSASGRYSFSDPAYRVFASTLLKQARSFTPSAGTAFHVKWEVLIEDATKYLNSALLHRRLEAIVVGERPSRQMDLRLDRGRQNDGADPRNEGERKPNGDT